MNNRVKRVEALLPEEVLRQGLRVDKTNPQILLLLALKSDDPLFDTTYLANMANSTLINELKRLPGGRRCESLRLTLRDAYLGRSSAAGKV